MGWFGGGDDVSELIARRKYDKAIDILRKRVEQGDADPRVRIQLSDVLIMSGQDREAVPILRELADRFASEGQAAKAIALLKKVEKIQPGRSDVETRLARLIKDKNKNKPGLASGGFRPREGLAAEGYEPAGAVFGAEHFDPEQAKVPTAEERIEAARQATWVPTTHAEAPEPEVPTIELPPVPEPQAADKEQILDAVKDVMPTPEPEILPEPEIVPESEAVATPLFQGFSQDELVAVMRGLRLLTFEPGDIIITEGDPGDSLFILTTGVVKAFLKNQGGVGQRMARTMADGAFFGEISILSGKPRTATVTAATRCELLELDKPTLDEITQKHPRVQNVLEEFYVARATSQNAGG